MDRKSSLLVVLGYVYILLPILIFFVGYCNLYTSILGTFFIFAGFYFLLKNAPKIWFPNNKKEWCLLGIIALICFLWVYSSGIGALVYQNLDHNCRNPIFENLVSNSWPVISADGEYILTYYIGFWFFPALIGKIFNSIQIGYYAQVLWASLGIFLTMYYVLSTLKNKTILPVIIFIFFSGLDILGSYLFLNNNINPFEITQHLEWWFPSFQFSGITTQLYWVFNQAIPAWIATMLLYTEKNNKNMLLIYSSLFLSSTLPAIGLLPIIIWLYIKNGISNKNTIYTYKHLLNSVKSGLTFSNIIIGGFIFIVCYSYLSNNLSGAIYYIRFVKIQFFAIWIILFFTLEVGIFLLCILNKYKHDPLFYICVLCFLIYPFIHVGYSADFCMRATIPAIMLLYLFIVNAFDDEDFVKQKLLCTILILSLTIGSISAIHEIARTVKYTSMGYKKVLPNLQGTNFFGYTKNNKFLKYFGNIKN